MFTAGKSSGDGSTSSVIHENCGKGGSKEKECVCVCVCVFALLMCVCLALGWPVAGVCDKVSVVSDPSGLINELAPLASEDLRGGQITHT